MSCNVLSYLVIYLHQYQYLHLRISIYLSIYLSLSISLSISISISIFYILYSIFYILYSIFYILYLYLFYTCLYAYVHVYIYICIYLYIYICIIMRIYIYILQSFAHRRCRCPSGLGAIVAVKLRSLCWQHWFEPGWYSREAEGPEQQREAESVFKSPEKGGVLRVARKRRAGWCLKCLP